MISNILGLIIRELSLTTHLRPILLAGGVFVHHRCILIIVWHHATMRIILTLHQRVLQYGDVLLLVLVIERDKVFRHVGHALCWVNLVLANAPESFQVVRVFVKSMVDLHIPDVYWMLLYVVWSNLHERFLLHWVWILPQESNGIFLHNWVGLQTGQWGSMCVIKRILILVVVLYLTSDLSIYVNALEDTDIYGLSSSFAEFVVLCRHVFFRIERILWVLDRAFLGLHNVYERITASLPVLFVVESVHVLSQELSCPISFSVLRILDGLDIILFIASAQTRSPNVKVRSCLIRV